MALKGYTDTVCRQGGGQVDIQNLVAIKAALHVPLSWDLLTFSFFELTLSHYLLTVCVYVTTDEAFSDDAPPPPPPPQNKLFTVALALKVHDILSNLSWEDLIRIYLLVWLGSGFTVGLVLISYKLERRRVLA